MAVVCTSSWYCAKPILRFRFARSARFSLRTDNNHRKRQADGGPVGGATVRISKDSNHLFNLTTDGSGQTSSEYPGETTIVIVSGGICTPEMKAIPRVPDSWIRETTNGLILGIASGVIVSAISKRYPTDQR